MKVVVVVSLFMYISVSLQADIPILTTVDDVQQFALCRYV